MFYVEYYLWPGICFTYNCVCVSESVGEFTSVLVSVTVDLAAKCYCNI